jgi:hypothetical protein
MQTILRRGSTRAQTAAKKNAAQVRGVSINAI